MILGAHRSTAGGAWKAVESGREIGCDAIQIFTRPPQRWVSKPVGDEEAAKFRQACSDLNLACVAHDIYLTNLAASNEEIRGKSIDSFRDELQRCEQLGIPWLVTHCGAHDGDAAAGVARVADALRTCIDEAAAASVTVLLEGTAGQGNALGSSFQELAAMLEQTGRPERTAVCLDTCHLFAAGYDLRTPEAFNKTFEEFDRVIGLDRLKVMHLNDAKKDLGSRVDRHDGIGKGKLGEQSFSILLNDSRFQEIPLLLETPELENHEAEIRLLRGLIHTGRA